MSSLGKYFIKDSGLVKFLSAFMIVLLPSIYGLEYAHHEICSAELETHKLHTDADICESDHWHTDNESDHECNLCSLYLNKINAYKAADCSSFNRLDIDNDNISYYSLYTLSEVNPNISSRAPPIFSLK